MKKTSPLAPVNIRTLNSAKKLNETLLSIQQQTYPHIEIIVSDDFSKYKGVSIAKEFGARVDFAGKLGNARQQDYENSRGKYIISLDSDQFEKIW